MGGLCREPRRDEDFTKLEQSLYFSASTLQNALRERAKAITDGVEAEGSSVDLPSLAMLALFDRRAGLQRARAVLRDSGLVARGPRQILPV